MKARKLSNHSISIYENCPHWYYLNYHTDRDENAMLPSDHFEMGNIVHETLEKLRPNPNPKKLEKFLSGVIEDSKTFTPDSSQRAKIKVWLRDWLRTRNLDAEVISVESEFNIPLNNYNINGFIDVIEKVDRDYFRVRDYKTSKKYKEMSEVRDSRQLKLYALAVREIYDVKRVEVGFDQIRYGPPDFVTHSDHELYEFLQYLNNVHDKISDDINHRPQMGIHCSWCPYNHSCKYVKELSKENEELKDMPLKSLARKYNQFHAREKTAGDRRKQIKKIIIERMKKAKKYTVENEDIKIKRIQSEYEYYKPTDVIKHIHMDSVDRVFRTQKDALKEVLSPSQFDELEPKKGKRGEYIKVTEKP